MPRFNVGDTIQTKSYAGMVEATGVDLDGEFLEVYSNTPKICGSVGTIVGVTDHDVPYAVEFEDPTLENMFFHAEELERVGTAWFLKEDEDVEI